MDELLKQKDTYRYFIAPDQSSVWYLDDTGNFRLVTDPGKIQAAVSGNYKWGTGANMATTIPADLASQLGQQYGTTEQIRADEQALENSYGPVQNTVKSTSGTYQMRNGKWYLGNNEVTDSQTLNFLSTTTQAINAAESKSGASSYSGNAQGNVNNTTNVPGASLPTVDDTALRDSAEFQALSEDQQQAVLQVYQAIAANDADNAERLAAAFKTSAAISDPFFKQELRLAVDALERGFVSIDQEEEYKARQLRQNQQQLEEDLQTKSDYLDFEEQAALRQIGRQYESDLKNVRQSMAATGKTFSSDRAETEALLEESTGDLRESTTRKFGIQQLDIQRTGERASQATQQELERLQQLSEEKRTNLLREGEAQVGTKNLPTLSGTEGINPLGDIVGDIPQRQTSDIISGAQNLMF